MSTRAREIATDCAVTAHWRVHTKLKFGDARPLALAAALAAAGCFSGEEMPTLGENRAAATVADISNAGCSTGPAYELSLQVAEEVTCIMPGLFERYEESDLIVFDGPVMPFLTPQAKQDMLAAVESQDRVLSINSGYRTVVQQYILYRFWQQGRCGITAAAVPGSSNHESGRALDVDDPSYWATVFPQYGWAQTVLPHDPWHYDHLDSPDLRGYDVLAFQRLWNRNHPEDPIDEDGVYGPQTAGALSRSPGEGFAVGACPTDAYAAEVAAVDAPMSMRPGDLAEVVVEVTNTGDAAWRPDATFLGTAAPDDRESAFYDPETWYGPDRPTSVEAETQPGEVGVFRFTMRAPEVEEEAVLTETFSLVEETVTRFGPEVTVEILVGEDVEPPDPPKTENDPSSDLEGGCATGGGSSGGVAVLLGLALVALRRRR